MGNLPISACSTPCEWIRAGLPCSNAPSCGTSVPSNTDIGKVLDTAALTVRLRPLEMDGHLPSSTIHCLRARTELLQLLLGSTGPVKPDLLGPSSGYSQLQC
jgi:hypothetical protein